MGNAVAEVRQPARRRASAADTRELCLRLLACRSEADVQAVLDASPDLRNPKNWRPLDRRETNFNVTSNQASDGGKALTELMTNMVDAVLMKHAFQRGIDPKGPKAPQTMYEAVDKLIKPLHGGKLVNLDPDDPWLRDFASKNLVIGVTGAKNKKEGLPCYTFVDNGEGQRPDDFERTFLSLSEGNKKSIPFVQGKYNMGSSGSLVISCGTQQSESMVIVEPGGHVGGLPLSLSTCPRGGSQEHGLERWSGGAVHQRVGTAAAVGG